MTTRWALLGAVPPVHSQLCVSRAALIGLLTLFGARSVSAHPNTRGLDRTLKDPASGRSVRLIWECGDGILAVDPCKLLLHDERDVRLGETEMARITSWVCWSDSDCVAFSFHSWLPVLPEQVWRIQGGSSWLVSTWWRPIGTVVHLWTSRFLYLPMLGLFFLPAVAARRELWSGRGVFRILGLGLVVTGSCVFLLLWLYLVVVLMPLSLPLLGMLIAVTVTVGHQLNNRREGQVTVEPQEPQTAGSPMPWVYAVVGLTSLGATLVSRLVWSTDLVEQSWQELAKDGAATAAIALFGTAALLGLDAQMRRLTGRALLAAVPAIVAFGPLITAMVAVVALCCTPFVARRTRHVVATILMPLGAAAIDAAFVLFRARLDGH